MSPPAPGGPILVTLSPRLAALVDALPLTSSSRVLEIGRGPGAAARAVARRVRHVHAIDRSPAAIRAVTAAGAAEIAAGRLSVQCVAVEDLVLGPDDEAFDLAFAVRVVCWTGGIPGPGLSPPCGRPCDRVGDCSWNGVERVLGAPARTTGQH